ncbi:26S protease regulatory subunit 7 [Tanacetum coccineum]
MTMMKVEEKPDVTYNDVGGCKEQIEKMREANRYYPGWLRMLGVTSDMASLPLVFLRSITDGLFGIDLTNSITIQIQFAT